MTQHKTHPLIEENRSIDPALLPSPVFHHNLDKHVPPTCMAQRGVLLSLLNAGHQLEHAYQLTQHPDNCKSLSARTASLTNHLSNQ